MSALELHEDDPLAIRACVTRLPLERALAELERLPRLGAPAKLAWWRREAALRVEVPRSNDLEAARACVRGAAATALAWLEGEQAPPATAQTSLVRALEEALHELGWSYTVAGDALEVTAAPTGLPVRLSVELIGADRLRASVEALLLLRGACVRPLQRLALESNHRQRFARVALRGDGEDRVAVTFDSVLPVGQDPQAALVEAAAAVVCARGAVWPGLRALRHPAVARAFEELRAREG